MNRKRQKKEPPTQEALRERAEKRAKNKTGLLWVLYSVGSYVVINGLLIAIWALSDSDNPWFLWVMAVWGIGLIFHIAGYIIGFRVGAGREAMIEEEEEKIKKKLGIAEEGILQPAESGVQPMKSEQDVPERTQDPEDRA